MQLTPHQQEAADTLLSALHNNADVVSLSGPAGSGKTTLLKTLVPLLEEEYFDVLVVTPTNKAAKVLNDKGLDAGTIHSRFFVPLPDVKPLKFVSAVEWVESGLALPDGKRDHAVVVVCDEASMLQTHMMNKLRQMAYHVVLVGDPHQLPPVNDRINSAGFFNSRTPTARLDEILRQAEGSEILDVATAIRTGGEFHRSLKAFGPELSFAQTVGASGDMPQFIAYTNKERAKANRLIRQVRGHISALPAVGEKMICSTNYSDLLLNGTECFIEDFYWNGHAAYASVRLRVETSRGSIVEKADVSMHTFLRDLQAGQQEGFAHKYAEWAVEENKYGDVWLGLRYGYCITAHASQGSEYESVVVLDQLDTIKYVAEQNKDDRMTPNEMVRRWVYTAITRAKQDLIFAPTHWVNAMGRAAA